MRLFIALPVSKKIKYRIESLQKELNAVLKESNIRWISPENMHITLVFLGNVENNEVTKIIKAVEDAAFYSESFEVEVKGVGVFPKLRRPRVIWIGCVDDKDQILYLKKAIDNELNKLGYIKEKRKFNAHITIGRIKQANYKEVENVLNNTEEAFGKMEISEVRLIESFLSPAGAKYNVIENIQL